MMEEVYIIMVGEYDWQGDYITEIHSVFANEKKVIEKVEELKQLNEFAQVWYIAQKVQ